MDRHRASQLCFLLLILFLGQTAAIGKYQKTTKVRLRCRMCSNTF